MVADHGGEPLGLLDAFLDRAGVRRRGRHHAVFRHVAAFCFAAGLGLTVAALALGAVRMAALEIVKAAQRSAHGTPHYGYEALAGCSDAAGIRFFISELLADGLDDFPELHVHDSQDFLYVLEGSVSARFAGESQFRLDVGDSLSFDGRKPHAFANGARSGEKPARVLWVSRALA